VALLDVFSVLPLRNHACLGALLTPPSGLEGEVTGSMEGAQATVVFAPRFAVLVLCVHILWVLLVRVSFVEGPEGASVLDLDVFVRWSSDSSLPSCGLSGHPLHSNPPTACPVFPFAPV